MTYDRVRITDASPAQPADLEDTRVEPQRFDLLAMRVGDSRRRGVLGGASRRILLRGLSALPLGGSLASLVAAADARNGNGKGKGNGKNGKNDHDNEVAADKNNARGRKKQCKKKIARACEGRCGTVTVRCKKRNGKTKRTQVNCGACTCDPPCGRCATCSAARRCEPCTPCCNDVCCNQANTVCHVGTGACCVPDSKAQTCHNACGQVVNNCGVAVDCGPCTCGGGCPVCHICDEQTDECVADPNQQGDACGEPGQVCQANGACACDANSCPACRTCENTGFCAACSGCCSGTTCEQGDSNAACGTGGTACVSCTLPETCGGGNPGTPGVCGCTPVDPCTAGVCGTVPNNCGQNVDCGGCDNPTPICVNHVCTACDSTNPCPGTQCCSGGQCVANCPACQSCSAGVCAPCADCCAGDTCQAGDTWAHCGTGGGSCTECARGEICAASSQTCAACESAFFPGTVTWCEAVQDFAAFKCAPGCGCITRHSGGIGVCFDAGASGYCNSLDPICDRNEDCVNQGLGNYCVLVGSCEAGANCFLTACVPQCTGGETSVEGVLPLLVRG